MIASNMIQSGMMSSRELITTTMRRANITPINIRDLATRLAVLPRIRGSDESGDSDDDESSTDEEPPSLYALMEEMVSIDERPFLLAHRRIHKETMTLDRKSIQIGELLRDGAFAQTYEISSCAQLAISSPDYFGFGSLDGTSHHNEPMGSQSESALYYSGRRRTSSLGERFRRRRVGSVLPPDLTEWGDETSHHCASEYRYTIKCLRTSCADDDSWNGGGGGAHARRRHTRHNNNNDLVGAARHLLLEALYLSVLDHPAIIKLQAFASPTSSCDQVFCVTDRIEETLEDRILLWRRMRRNREEQEAKHYRKEKKRMERINNQRTRRRSCDTPADYRKRQESTFLLATPSPFQQEVKSLYPEDLVALKTNYALQIASALEYLHARGIVVCDLRPDTIGFKEYPNHHTVQIIDLSSAKELPMEEDQPFLPATEIPQCSSTESTPDLSETSHSCTVGSGSNHTSSSGMDDSTWMSYSAWSTVAAPFKRVSSGGGGVPVGAVGMDAPHRSHPTRTRMATPTDSSSATSASSLASSAWSIDESSSQYYHHSSGFQQRRRTCKQSSSSASSGVSPSYKNRRCYRAPEIYMDLNHPGSRQHNRFNAKVDSYSWAMIFYELLADRRPFPPNYATTDQDHLQRVRDQQLRPSLRQCYFPLTIQEILQQSWLPTISQRWNASQIVKSLTRVLPVLEGQGLHHGRRSITGPSHSSSMTRRRRHSTMTNTVTAPLTLPQRAAKVVHSKGAKGWEQVRKSGGLKRRV